MEDSEMSVVVEFVECAGVDGSDTKLALDGRYERRTLEEGTSQGLQSSSKLCFASGNLFVESYDTDILFSGALL
jgi:hypothetical protein